MRMRGHVESTDLRAVPPPPDQFLLDEAPADDDCSPWVVLIGAGSDSEEALDFLQDLCGTWPASRALPCASPENGHGSTRPRGARMVPMRSV